MTRLFLFLLLQLSSICFAQSPDVNFSKASELKGKIIRLAAMYQGQADPDLSKQVSLEILVNQLLVIAPQKPVSERLQSLYGAWKQVWGTYNYRKNDRSVDPTIGIEEIYQVIFKDGHYYNVSPSFKNGKRTDEKISFLRGEFKLSADNDDELDVKFTNLTELAERPGSVNLWDLATQAETNTLPGEKTTLPNFLVRLFFQGGSLKEVYTDEGLRILYGTNSRIFETPYLYVMIKVGG